MAARYIDGIGQARCQRMVSVFKKYPQLCSRPRRPRLCAEKCGQRFSAAAGQMQQPSAGTDELLKLFCDWRGQAIVSVVIMTLKALSISGNLRCDSEVNVADGSEIGYKGCQSVTVCFRCDKYWQ